MGVLASWRDGDSGLKIYVAKSHKVRQKKTCLIASALILVSAQSCQDENLAWCTDRLFCTVNVRYCSIYYDPSGGHHGRDPHRRYDFA